jgi:hypothetical protein
MRKNDKCEKASDAAANQIKKVDFIDMLLKISEYKR